MVRIHTLCMSMQGRKLQVLLTLASFTEVTGFCGSKHLVVERDCRLLCGRAQLMPMCGRKLNIDIDVQDTKSQAKLDAKLCFRHVTLLFQATGLLQR